jgi:hypothetical protein
MNWIWIKNIFDVLGHISTGIVIVSVIVAISLWIRGIAPVLWRLGNGLSRRKIAIFAKGDMLISLESLLDDSKLFDKTNISRISSAGDFGKAEEATLFIVYWPDWTGDLASLLSRKKDGTAMIVYAPQDQGLIPSAAMATLNNQRNVTVTNFRGRLLNDIVTSMITTSYEKR